MISSHKILILIAIVFGTAVWMLPAQAQKIDGFIVTHDHLMNEHAWGGSFLHGSAYGIERQALHRCDGNLFTQSHASLRGIGAFAIELIGDDGGLHGGKRNGFETRKCRYFFGFKIPGSCEASYTGWPSHKSHAHQQMWYGYLKDAFEGGLAVTMVSIHESFLLCYMTPEHKRSNRYRHRNSGCNEMDSVLYQLDQFNRFALNHRSWMEVARTPQEVRDIHARGKLAVLLAVEVSNLFPEGNYRQQLKELNDRGVVSVQLVHHTDNKFAGAGIIKLLNTAATLAELTLFDNFSRINETSCGLKCTIDNRNKLGLTSDGEVLVKEMMRLGMVVDFAHVSAAAFDDAARLMRTQGGNYPIFVSHAHILDSVTKDSNKEQKDLTRKQLRHIKRSGGFLGLRTGELQQNDYRPKRRRKSVTNSRNECIGSVRSWSQALMRAVDAGVSVGYATDFNGFISQVAPSCESGGPNAEFRTRGLAHIGLLPQMNSELRYIGMDLYYRNHLNNSAETFIQMWETAQNKSSKLNF